MLADAGGEADRMWLPPPTSSSATSPHRGADHTWAADVIQFWTTEGWLYFAGDVDLFSRRVVGWAMGASLDAALPKPIEALYPGSDHPALEGVDLEVRPGRRIAVVGASGAGKTTLADVLLRFLAVDAGCATLGGISFEQLAGDDLRRVVGLVDQGPHLFSTSLAENLRVARRDASDQDLRRLLVRVGLGSWLATLDCGLDAPVGSFGAKLSGGQRQRVAVARVLLADFPILVLDEPTEHLDLRAADDLMADLLTLTEDRGVLLVTHRLAGLEHADEILVLEDGHVVERGGHRELLVAEGRYARAWDSQRAQGTIDLDGSDLYPRGSAVAANPATVGGERRSPRTP